MSEILDSIALCPLEKAVLVLLFIYLFKSFDHNFLSFF